MARSNSWLRFSAAVPWRLACARMWGWISSRPFQKLEFEARLGRCAAGRGVTALQRLELFVERAFCDVDQLVEFRRDI